MWDILTPIYRLTTFPLNMENPDHLKHSAFKSHVCPTDAADAASHLENCSPEVETKPAPLHDLAVLIRICASVITKSDEAQISVSHQTDFFSYLPPAVSSLAFLAFIILS